MSKRSLTEYKQRHVLHSVNCTSGLCLGLKIVLAPITRTLVFKRAFCLRQGLYHLSEPPTF